MSRVVDIDQMPGRSDTVKNGMLSVTEGKVYFGLTGKSQWEVPTVCCTTHGAMNCMAVMDVGKIWRCVECNEGAFQPSVRP